MEQIKMMIKKYEELEFRDDFMFGKVMQDKELCRDVLECLLQRPVGELSDIDSQKEFRCTSDGKPIKLDIYTRDDQEIYDAEMQNKGHKTLEDLALPKRSIFYQSSIDTDYMEKGYHYKKLPDSKVLFICTFDPFEKGLAMYTFTGRCEEDNSIAIDDGSTRIFYNCTYKGNDLPEDIGKFYEYVETGKCSDVLTKRIDEAVQEARKKEEWRSDYMKERVLIMDAIEEERRNTERERQNTERERTRANIAEEQVKKLKARVIELESQVNA